ncbi:MAG: hypothetical protein JST92_22540 [Deltaproteobacteria bacterium]|nr:hypothetical protein [Deltaproteobacteria bacterium]
MARKETSEVAATASSRARPAKNGAEREPKPRKLDEGKVGEAKKDLLERGAVTEAGALQLRSDPLADAVAARAIVEAAGAHEVELTRRGLTPHHCAAALELAAEMESALQSLPAAAVSARGRSADAADLIEEAASLAHNAREAVLRVSRGADGRSAARSFGLGELMNARQPAHVQRALKRLLEGAKEHPAIAKDAGLLPEDLQSIKSLLTELAGLAGQSATRTDESETLHRAHAALRAFFDLFAAKSRLILAADPEERVRVLSLLPRATERRRRGMN